MRGGWRELLQVVACHPFPSKGWSGSTATELCTPAKVKSRKFLFYWRSREKWISRATATSWAHKHPYPRSLNLKAVLPELQTLSISSAIGATTYKIRIQRTDKSSCVEVFAADE